MASMEPERRHRTLAVLCAQLLWVLGTLGSYFLGALYDPVVAIAALAVTFAATLVIARRSNGWRAVPAMFMALALQAPLLVGLGIYALGLPVEYRPTYPCYFWRGTSLELLQACAGIATLTLPVGALLRLDARGLRRLRRAARIAAPVVLILSATLVGLAAARLAQFPALDRYFDSLPVEAVVPVPTAQPCEPIDDRLDPKHDPGWPKPKLCATPEVAAGALAFHYHVQTYSPDDVAHHLHYRARDARDVGLFSFWERPSEVVVKRDDSLKAWLVRDPYPHAGILIVSLEGPRWRLFASDVRGRVAPPAAWLLLASGGLLASLACLGVGRGLRRFVAETSGARHEWVDERRGELSLIATSIALTASALLLAAWIEGLLT